MDDEKKKVRVFRCKVLFHQEDMDRLRRNIEKQVARGTVLLPTYIEYLGDADDIKIIRADDAVSISDTGPRRRKVK